MHKGKICVIEDDEILSKVLTAELMDAGFEVSSAGDGEKGLALIGANNPDLVLLDVLMPKKNGLEVLAIMKKSPSLRNIPVILLTALGSDEDIKKGILLGATDYIIKSQHPIAEIVEKITNFFEKTMHPHATTITKK